MFLSLRNIPPGFATKLQWLNATGKIVILCGCITGTSRHIFICVSFNF